ncbi:hypothetical protein [Fluviispira multicolorata]|uniref:Uncharacterized protein n=1 Tax=Fluviispira multicolorata TaxID=2654512 RepID=A0A833JEL8_9BACT|nr:hypothetical protein [Fluviispira multicolorata]KAB8031969.1 hypothetical protein GCL57_04805 [Fluviispira multicolorata]
MTLAIVPNDIVWTRNGDPIRVEKTNPKTGKIILDPDFEKIQDTAQTGIKNGLEPKLKDAYKTSLSDIEGEEKRQEIRDLYAKIESLKNGNTDQRVIKYLENELQYRIVREKFAPENFAVDPITLGI